MKRIALAVLFTCLAAPAANAQSGGYPVKNMDFGLWCTEQAHLPFDRCVKRLPEDEQRFEAYRAVIEKYEVPYLQEKEQKLRFDRDILHNDPVDNSPEQESQPPVATDGKTP
jgi:hypothetical protein